MSMNDKGFKTMNGCMMGCPDSTKQKAEFLQSKAHEEGMAGKGFTSMTRHDLVHEFIPMPQAMKILDAKAAVDKEWKKFENSSMGWPGRWGPQVPNRQRRTREDPEPA